MILQISEKDPPGRGQRSVSAAREAVLELVEIQNFSKRFLSRADACCHGDLDVGLHWCAIIVNRFPRVRRLSFHVNITPGGFTD